MPMPLFKILIEREQHSFNTPANIHKKFNSCAKPPHLAIKNISQDKENGKWRLIGPLAVNEKDFYPLMGLTGIQPGLESVSLEKITCPDNGSCHASTVEDNHTIGVKSGAECVGGHHRTVTINLGIGEIHIVTGRYHSAIVTLHVMHRINLIDALLHETGQVSNQLVLGGRWHASRSLDRDSGLNHQIITD